MQVDHTEAGQRDMTARTQYFLQRASEEEKAAAAALSLAARWRHEELACLYRARAESADGEVPPAPPAGSWPVDAPA